MKPWQRFLQDGSIVVITGNIETREYESIYVQDVSAMESDSRTGFHHANLVLLLQTNGDLWFRGQREQEIDCRYTDGIIELVKMMDNVAAVSLGWGLGAALKLDGTLWYWTHGFDDYLRGDYWNPIQAKG